MGEAPWMDLICSSHVLYIQGNRWSGNHKQDFPEKKRYGWKTAIETSRKAARSILRNAGWVHQIGGLQVRCLYSFFYGVVEEPKHFTKQNIPDLTREASLIQLVQSIAVFGKKISNLFFKKKINANLFRLTEVVVGPGIEKTIPDHNMGKPPFFQFR